MNNSSGKFRFHIGFTIFICFLVLAFFYVFIRPIYEVGYEVGNDHGYDAGYEVGYDYGYSSGYETGYKNGYDAIDTPDCYNKLDFMTPDEIHEYLESVTEDRYFDSEEVSSIFAYAFQRGYTACSSGVISDMEDEYLNGYLIDSNTALEYDLFFGLG